MLLRRHPRLHEQQGRKLLVVFSGRDGERIIASVVERYPIRHNDPAYVHIRRLVGINDWALDEAESLFHNDADTMILLNVHGSADAVRTIEKYAAHHLTDWACEWRVYEFEDGANDFPAPDPDTCPKNIWVCPAERRRDPNRRRNRLWERLRNFLRRTEMGLKPR